MEFQVATSAAPAIHIFTICAELPLGVTADEYASHLADAHRCAARNYHHSDPMAGAAEIVVTLDHG